MKKTDNISRNYSGSDSKLISRSKVVVECAKEDILDFTSFDSTVTDTYLLDLKNKINECEKIATNTASVNLLSKQTKSVEDELLVARNEYRGLQYFVEKAFKNNQKIINEFGCLDYGKVNTKPDKFVLLLKLIAESIVNYEAALIAVGYEKKHMDAFKTQINVLDKAISDQELGKLDRPNLTQARISQLNDIYQKTLGLCKAGTIIYLHNPTKYKRYVFYNEGGSVGNPLIINSNQESLKPIKLSVMGEKDRIISINFGDGTIKQIDLTGSLQDIDYNYELHGNYILSIMGEIKFISVIKLTNAGISNFIVPHTMQNLTEIDLTNNELTDVVMNQLMISLDYIGSEKGKVSFEGPLNHLPTGKGFAAVHSLKLKEWTFVPSI